MVGYKRRHGVVILGVSLGYVFLAVIFLGFALRPKFNIDLS
jgi:hypothetical protein